MTFDSEFHTQIVKDHQDTIEFCKLCAEPCDYYVYRPLVGILSDVNQALNGVMYHRSHQPEC